MNFPNIKPPNFPLDENLQDPGIRSPMENGSVVSRARYTRIRRIFNLRWSSLPNADKETLFNFYENDIRGSSLTFNWTHPETLKTYVVRMTSLRAQKIRPGFWLVDATLEEA